MTFKRNLYCIIAIVMNSYSYAQTVKGIIYTTSLHAIEDVTELSEKAKTPRYSSYIYSNDKSIQELISVQETAIDVKFISHPESLGQFQETTSISLKPHKLITYKDYTNDVYRLEASRKNRDLITEHTSIKDHNLTFNWTLHDETKIILGYTCKKATTEKILFGRKTHTTAWYTEEIPFNDGPGYFNGLPGLILELKNNEHTLIRFEEIEVFKDKETILEAPKNKNNFISINEFQRSR
ncbi:GLPGLI family protein [Formosa algae]|uniref:GLPGLI family protein n=1 Tax=Formosa algae TaxID=225843 RepID=UPI000CD2F2F8|nr:GLPGLI family protein [Formosa algae]